MKKENKDCLVIVTMFIFIAIAYSLCYSTIKERQAQYERVTGEAVVNSVSCDKASCNNYDYTKGVN